MPWLLPSRRRPHNLRRFFAAAKAMETSTPGFIIVKRDEWEELKDEYQQIELVPGWRFAISEEDGQGDKIRQTRREGLWGGEGLHPKDDWVALIGDDQTPATPHWDALLVGELKGWNMISCNDNWTFQKRKGRIAGPQIYSGPLIRTLGYIFPPGMQHLALDDVYEDLGHATGCWQVRQDVLVEHHHYQNGGAPNDDTYVKAYANGATDMPRYAEWKGRERDEAVDRIRALMRTYGVEPHEHELPILVGPNQQMPEFNGIVY